MKIILTSKSNIKESALQLWAKEILKKKIFIEKLEINNKFLPEQPINSGIEIICEKRITFIENEYSNIIKSSNYIVSIENGIEIKENKIIDKVCVIIKNIVTGKTKTFSGSPITIEYKNLNGYSKIKNIIDDFIFNYKITNNKYDYDGSSITFGNLINKYYPQIPANNWMKVLCNKDRIYQIFDVLKIICNLD